MSWFLTFDVALGFSAFVCVHVCKDRAASTWPAPGPLWPYQALHRPSELCITE